MKKYLLFLIAIILLTCSRDWDNPVEVDEDLKHTPKIVQIQTNSEYDIEIILDYGYSEESTIILERKTIGGFSQIFYRKLDQATLVDTSFDKESDYTFIYRVQVEKNGYRTVYSSEQTFQSVGVLNSPADLQVRIIELQGVRLEWRDKSSKEEGYKIEKNDGSGFSEIADLSSNSNSYLDAIGGIPPTPLQLSYRVKAYTNTQSSEWKEIATSYSGLGSPTNLRITDTTSFRFTVEWEDNSNIETGYTVERQRDNNGYDEIANLGANVTQYIDLIIEVGIYTYRVRAKKDNLYSIYSNEVSYNIMKTDIPTEGLVAYYPFNGNANDESGNGNDGTVYGATLTTDRFGNANSAYSFDGVDDYVAYPTLWSNSPQVATVEAWIYPLSLGRVVVYHGDNGEIIINGSEISAKFTDANWYSARITVTTPNKWCHIVGLWKKGEYLKLFVDGELKASTLIPNLYLYDPGTGFLPSIGAYSRRQYAPSGEFSGFIDEVRIYNRVLTENEIQALYHEGGWGN